MSKLLKTAENQIGAMIKNAFETAVSRGELSPCALPEYRIETPADGKRGNLAVNAAFTLSKAQNKTPRAVADILANYIRIENTCFGAFNASAGFINFFFNGAYYAGILLDVMATKDAYGCLDGGAGKAVSVGLLPAKGDISRSVRGAVRGDCLADIFTAAGYRTKRVLFAGDAVPDCFSEYRVAFDMYESRPPCETDTSAVILTVSKNADSFAIPAAFTAVPAGTPVDYVRFVFSGEKAHTPLAINPDLAVEQSSQNPVYYCQYAHARISSIFAKLKADGIAVGEASPEELALLISEPEKALITHIAALSGEIAEAAKQYNPARITQYAIELASRFHKFYNAQRVVCKDEKLTRARLALCGCTRTVMKNVLTLLKIDAPDKM